MNSPIQHRLDLVLKVSSEFTTNAISKSLIISQVLFEELLKFGLYHQGPLRAMFMLVPMLYDWPTEKRRGKWDAIGLAGFGGIKVIFTLLKKAVAV